MLFITRLKCLLLALAMAGALEASQQPPSNSATSPSINWSPTIHIPLQTKGLCIFTDQGSIFIIHDAGVSVPQFDMPSFWASHTIIPHDQATIHVLKTNMLFNLRVTPYLDLTLDPTLTGNTTILHLHPINLQQSDKTLTFQGLKTHKIIQFVHEGRRFQAVMTRQVDEGFGRQIDVRPYFRVLPSFQGVAVQLDAESAVVQSAPASFTITTPFPGYHIAQQSFWSQVQYYGQKDRLANLQGTPLVLGRAMQALNHGDAAAVKGILEFGHEGALVSEYHPLVRTLHAWADYMLDRTCQSPHLLSMDDAANWPGFYGDSPFCHAGFWENVRWQLLPNAIFQRVWESALKEAHHHQCIPALRTLMENNVAERGNPVLQSFYKAVVARVDEPHRFEELLKGFLYKEVRATACSPDLRAWGRYYVDGNRVQSWNPFVPLWQLHNDMEGAFKAKRYREVLAALIASPFNPVLGDVFQAILANPELSSVEKIGLYERVKTSLPTETCEHIISQMVNMWCDLDLMQEAGTLLVSNQSTLSDELRERLWLKLADCYASKQSWGDVEHALRQMPDNAASASQPNVQLQQAALLWNTGKQDEAIRIWNSSSNEALMEQSARFLMQAQRYKEAVKPLSLLISLKGKSFIHPYAVCLWHLGDKGKLLLLHKTYADDPWLECLVNASSIEPPTLDKALKSAQLVLQKAADMAKSPS